MHQNKIFLALLIFITGLSLWFGGRGAAAFIHYMRLNTEAVANVEKYEIEESKGDKYRIIAKYFFTSAGETIAGSSPVGPLYKNPWSAERGIERIKRECWQVWYNKNRPEQSSLSKSFPLRQLLSAAVVLGLFVYFLALGVYVGGKGAR